MRFVTAILLSSLAVAGNAVPFTFEYTGTIDASGITGISIGNPVTVTVTADNGGTGISNQTWRLVNIKSARLVAGAYTANYLAAFTSSESSGIVFATAESGVLVEAFFTGAGSNSANFDGEGDGASLTGSTIFASDMMMTATFSPALNQLPNWAEMPTLAPPSIPEPSTVLALVIGLAGMLGARLRPRGG
ncbi:MAG: PEP-CTERM sorting domain-containing protein [Gammaproteobacteria bacterium]|nr:PEP-CTERM sorting domain-containing protein [Gammaproteobacteria bacterium]